MIVEKTSSMCLVYDEGPPSTIVCATLNKQQQKPKLPYVNKDE